MVQRPDDPKPPRVLGPLDMYEVKRSVVYQAGACSDDAPGTGSGTSGFNSHQLGFITRCSEVVSRLLREQEIGGSIPLTSTNERKEKASKT